MAHANATMAAHTFSRHYESEVLVPAKADALFAHLDDPARLSSHMEQSSWMMGGGRMTVETDDGGGRRVGSHIRLGGRVFGMEMSLDEVVTERVSPVRKVWQTTGAPRLLVIGHYRMGFEIRPDAARSRLRVFIDYALPTNAGGRWLGYLFARTYAAWCTRRMARDAAEHFAVPLKNA